MLILAPDPSIEMETLIPWLLTKSAKAEKSKPVLIGVIFGVDITG